MNGEKAKDKRIIPRRKQEDLAPPSRRTGAGSKNTDAQSRVGNAVVAKQQQDQASVVTTPEESTVLQSGIGNGAIAQAAAPTDQLDLAPAQSELAPAFAPSFIFPGNYFPIMPADSYLKPGFEPSGLYSPLLATESLEEPSTAPPTVPLVTPLDEEIVEPYGPTQESTPQQPVTTIVFEEETIVGRVPEAERPATTEGEPKKEGEAVAAEPTTLAKDEKTKEEEKAAEETAEKAKTETVPTEPEKPEEAKAEAKKTEAELKKDQPKEEEVKKAEETAGQEVVEAGAEGAQETAPPKDEKEAKEEAGHEEKEGAGPAPELADWKGKVSGATKGIKAPPTEDAGQVESRVRKVGGASDTRAATARKTIEKEAEKVVPPPPTPPDPLPVPAEDPTGATQRVRDASGKTLPNQTLPVLEKGPLETMPVMSGKTSDAYSTKVMTQSEIAAEEAKKAEAAAKGEEEGAKGKKDPDKEKAKKTRDAKDKKKPVAGAEAPAEPLVLVDEGPPPPAPMTKSAQSDVGKVLAVLLADPRSAAIEIINDARGEPWEGALLEDDFDPFGDEVLPTVEPELTKQLDAIREAAGITKEQLDAHVADRQKEVREKALEALTFGLYKPAQEEKEKAKEEGQKNAEAVAGAKEKMDLNTEQQMEAAAGESDPEVIKAKRERLLRGVGQKVAQQVVAYTQAGERREKALTDMEKPMQSAYILAGRADEEKIYKDLLKASKPEKDKEKEKEREKTARDQAGLAVNPKFVWIKTKLIEVSTEIGKLKTAAKDAAGKLVKAVRDAGDYAREAIKDWAGKRIGERQSWWQNLLDLFRDWSEKANYEAEAWEQAKNLAERDAVVRDLDALRMVEEAEARGIDASALSGAAELTEEQRAVVASYYEGPAKGDKIAAVAAGMRARLSARHRPGLISTFKQKLLDLPDSRWDDIDLIASIEQPGGTSAREIASEVYWATEQWGTDEPRIYKALSNMTPLRATAARKYYRHRGWGDMDAELRDELSGAELTRAEAQLAGDQSLADAAALREAISGAGTDEDTIMQVLRNKSPEEQARIKEAYKREYGDDLDADLKDDLGGHDLMRAEALRSGDVMKADAIALDQSMHGGFWGGAFGGDKDQAEAVYSQMDQEVHAEAVKNGWDAARTEEEIKKRHAQLSGKYADVKGITDESARKEALRNDLGKSFTGPEKDLVLAVHDRDLVAADAARIEIERRSAFYASDDVLLKAVDAQGKRARSESELDARAAEIKLQERIDIAELRGFPLDEKVIESERQKIKDDLEKNTKERAARYMTSLETKYDKDYGRYGKGSLRIVLALNMSGTERSKALDIVKGGGLLTPEQELDYAVREEDADSLKGQLDGKKKEDIDKIVAAWEEKHKPRKFADYVGEEFEGRDLHDIKQKLKGEPQTPREALERAKEDLEFEKSAYGAADYFAKSERREMEKDVKRLEEQVARLDELEKGGKKGTPEYEREFRRYKLRKEYFNISVKDNRAKIDSVTDTVATIAAIVATVVAIVVISVLTAGAGVGVLAAVMAGMTKASVAAGAAVASTLATVAVKKGFKGKAYTTDELTDDLTVGAVEAVASAVTAGLGGKLLAAGRLAKLAQSTKIMPRLFANAVAEGAEGFASSLPGALTGALVNDKNWKGDPFANIVGGTLMGVGMGTVLSGGMGMLGGISKPMKKGVGKLAGEADEFAEGLVDQARKHPPVETADVLAKRGTPAERAAGWKSFKEANPGKSYDDFLAELDAGIVAHKADEEAVRQANKKMRQELFTDIPPQQRKQFEQTAIDVVSDAEFERLTRSAKGQAVVIIEDGKPRVLMRESADPKVLREEGIHLMQSVDPTKAHLFKKLDEATLKNWDNLPLDEQLSIYRAKLDLEIDGQQQLIKNLDDQLAAVGDDAAARKQIMDRLEEARDTLDNLTTRLDEVGTISPQKQLDMASGKVAKPDYLDQPARLFSKKAESAEFKKALKAAGFDTKKAKKILDDAHMRSGAKKELAKTLTEVSDAVKKLDPVKAKAYLDDVMEVLEKRVDAVDDLASLVALSAKAKDPVAVMGAVKKLAGTGLDDASRVTKSALSDVSQKISSMKPDSGQKFLNSLTEVIDACPTKPIELSGFFTSAAKMKDPTDFIKKLKSMSDFLKAQPSKLPEGSLSTIGDKLAELGAGKKAGAAYFDAVDDLLRTHKGNLDQLDGFFIASTKSKDPAVYLGIVKDLNARKAAGAISDESFEMLSKKAATGAVDMEWLAKTDLFKLNTKESNDILDFLAFDKNTPWADFMDASKIKPHKIGAAWKDPKLRRILQSTSKAVRGAAGELVVLEQATALLKALGHDLDQLLRQHALIGTVSDYLARLKNAIEIGVEVKSYSQTFWRNFKKAEEKIAAMMGKGKTYAQAYAALSDREKGSHRAVWELLTKQLPASAASGQPPILIISDVVGKIGNWSVVETLLRTNFPPGTQLAKIAEGDILKKSKLIRALLGIP